VADLRSLRQNLFKSKIKDMPTKRQLQKMSESEMEYPQIRRSDDPMFNSNSPASNDAKPTVICSVCPYCMAYNRKEDDEFTICWNCGNTYRVN